MRPDACSSMRCAIRSLSPRPRAMRDRDAWPCQPRRRGAMTTPRLSTAFLILFGSGAPTWAQQAPSFAKQVRPLLARYCLECHNAKDAKGDLNLETFAALMKGGKSGEVVVPGKPDES